MANPEDLDEPFYPDETYLPMDDGLFPDGFFWGYFASGIYFVGLAFWLWMIVDCIRRDPDRTFWIWILIFVPFFGSIVYFFARYIPSRDVRVPQGMQRFSRGKELKQLRYQAHQIGNAHHFVQWGDALRETNQLADAQSAYNRALEKEADNLPALWGSALVEYELKNYPLAETRLRTILDIEPKYKFGDVSLYFAKTIYDQKKFDEAQTHLVQHIKQWRQPEGIVLLAQIYIQQGNIHQAKTDLEALLIEIEGSPTAIARQQSRWRRQAHKLLKSLG